MNNSSSDVKRKIEYAAYAVIALAALGYVLWLVRRPAETPKQQLTQTIHEGVMLGEPTDWSAYDRTLVLVLRKGCRYCALSAPFYKRLTALAANSRRVHLTAVLPQTIPQAKEYLALLGVEIEDVRQASLQSLKVPGTPTLLLVDGRGTVQNMWYGQLPREYEDQVLNVTGLTRVQ